MVCGDTYSVVIDDGETKIYVNGAAGWYRLLVLPWVGSNLRVCGWSGNFFRLSQPHLRRSHFLHRSTYGRLVIRQLQQPKAQLHLPELWLAGGPNQSWTIPDYTEIYGKKDSNITAFTIGHSGSGSFSATGLTGTGLTLNSATGILSGTPRACWHIQHHQSPPPAPLLEGAQSQ